MRKLIIAGFFLVAMLQVPAQAQSPTAIRVLILDLAGKANALAGAEAIASIPGQIQRHLLDSPDVKIIERKKLQEILQEQALSQSGIIDQSQAVQVGKLAAAEKIMVGEFAETADHTISLNVRLVDVELGLVEKQWLDAGLDPAGIEKFSRIVAAETATHLKYLTGLKNIARLSNPQQPFRIRLTVNNTLFAPGDMINFTAESDQNCYLYLFDIGTSGRIHLLFPNRAQKNNYLAAGRKLVIGNILVSPPAGVEAVKAIATLDSISLGKMIDAAGSTTMYQCVGEDSQQFARDLQVVVSPLPNDRWSSDLIQFNIVDSKQTR